MINSNYATGVSPVSDLPEPRLIAYITRFSSMNTRTKDLLTEVANKLGSINGFAENLSKNETTKANHLLDNLDICLNDYYDLQSYLENCLDHLRRIA